MLERLDLNILRKHEDEAATKGFFGGLVLGLLLGVVLTLVFAPRRGDETRAAVAGKAEDLRHKAADLVGRSHSDGAVAPDSPVGDDFANGVAIEREITVDEPMPQSSS